MSAPTSLASARAERESSRRRHPSQHRGVSRLKRKPAGHRSGVFVALLVVVATLTLLGLVMVLSASSVVGLQEHGSSWHFFKRQAVWVGVGTAALLLLFRVDYHRWRRFAVPLSAVAFGMLVLVLVPGIGVTVNGSTRWLAFGPMQFQPSELAKLAIVVLCADLLAAQREQDPDARLRLRPVLVVLATVSGLLLVQPNLGTAIVMATIVLLMLLAAGASLARLGLLTALAAGAAAFLALWEGYRRARVFAFLDPWADPLNSGYQTIQSLIGTASGGLFGVGLGASRAKWGFLPFAHTDFIFAIIAEELGLLGALVVVALFAALAALGIRVAHNAPDTFGALLATGITAWFAVQAVINIGAVLAVLPITGVPLPFVSFGGSSMVVSLAATGLLLNVARQSH